MAGVNGNLALAEPFAPSEQAWADLDREWAQFWAGLEAHAHNPAAWFTPARASQLGALLARGEQWLAASSHERHERGLYACHLRRLQPVLVNVQRALGEIAAHLLQQRRHLQAAREWAGSQAPRVGK
ncbi:MAG TPA: hypothetical protein VN690_11310 [Terriglobales bacterium]|nr:hypothetical protein [Terriglobales bacterium]